MTKSVWRLRVKDADNVTRYVPIRWSDMGMRRSMTEEQAYAALCDGCWRESQCHEDLQFCDEYLEATEGEG